ncbi:hypothetical protein [Desulfovibrio sp.]|uniref:hypothetical protein n=1 Tax=Desulfovibrio sp. TaxID=885 RepID=UPI0025C25FD4|nr:hypothetical protein [Desulfovibrio sp.]
MAGMQKSTPEEWQSQCISGNGGEFSSCSPFFIYRSLKNNLCQALGFISDWLMCFAGLVDTVLEHDKGVIHRNMERNIPQSLPRMGKVTGGASAQAKMI